MFVGSPVQARAIQKTNPEIMKIAAGVAAAAQFRDENG